MAGGYVPQLSMARLRSIPKEKEIVDHVVTARSPAEIRIRNKNNSKVGVLLGKTAG